MTDNILSFPKDKIVREGVQNIEAVDKMKTKGVQNFADTVVEDAADVLLSVFSQNGLDIENEKFIKDFHYMICILGATVYRSVGIDHPFHSFIDDNVVMKTEEEHNQATDE